MPETKSDIEFRTAAESDIHLLIDLLLQYHNQHHIASPDRGKLSKMLLQLQKEPNYGRQFVALRDGKPIGFATFFFIFSTSFGEKVAILSDLFVEERYRHQGIGEHLFKYCADSVRKLGYRHIDWVTLQDNFTAKKFFEKIGAKLQPYLFFSLDF